MRISEARIRRIIREEARRVLGEDGDGRLGGEFGGAEDHGDEFEAGDDDSSTYETRVRGVLESSVYDDDYDDDWDGTSDEDDGEEDLSPGGGSKEEESVKRSPPNVEDPAYADDVAYVIACFCRTWITGTSLKRLKELAESAEWRHVKEPDGGWRYVKINDQEAEDQRRAAEHLISIFSKAMEYYESHSEDNFVASPQYFLDSLSATVYRQHPEMGQEIRLKASKEHHLWLEGVDNLNSACERISAWLRTTYDERNKQYSAGYLDAIEVIKQNPREIENLRYINGTFSKIAQVLKFGEDEDQVEIVLDMVLSGPEGAMQVGQVLDTLS